MIEDCKRESGGANANLRILIQINGYNENVKTIMVYHVHLK